MAEYIRQDHHLPHGSLEPHITNGDRIRQMTDEELAEYISHFCDCDRGDCPVYTSSINCGIGCKQAWLNWLRRGAEDG